MFNSFKKKLARNHRKAATRQMGLSAYYKYVTGFCLALVYVFVFSITALKDNIEITKSVVTGQVLTASFQKPVINERLTQKEARKTVSKPYILTLPPIDLSNTWYYKEGGFAHIVGLNKKMQHAMFFWELHTNKKIFEQPFMQKNPKETPEDDYNYYKYPDMTAAVRGSLSEILNMRYKVEISAEIKDAACKKSSGINGFSKQDIFTTLNSGYSKATDRYWKCLDKPDTKAITQKGVCVYENSTVFCGEHIRDYVRRVYNAKTDNDLFQAWPIFQHLKEYNAAKIGYTFALNKNKRENLQQVKKPNSSLLVANILKENGSGQGFLSRVKFADINQIEALRVTVLFGACIVLFVYLVAGHKYAIIRPPKFIGKHFYIFSIPFFALYVWSFYSHGGSAFSSAFKAATFFIPPMLILTLPTYNMVFWEFIKEHPEYREWGILGKKGGSGRWGGIREYFKRDITDLMRKTQINGVQKTNESTLYLGKTNFKDDYQIGGRHIGLVSENHLIINSASGGGKSLYSITNMLAMWNGGAVIFDVKGEHWNTTAEHRARFGDTHLLDPFGVVRGRESDQWNPLAEIDPNSKTAKADLQRLCEAIIFESGDTKKNDHFSEIGQQVITGFCAHVLTAFPEEKRHLGSVYDLFEMGRLQGEEPRKVPALDAKYKPMLDSTGAPVMRNETHDEAMERLFADMKNNEAIGGAAREAVDKLQRVGANERGSFYSTISKSIVWVNDESVRPVITGRHDFSVRDAKTKESWCFLALPESYLDLQMRFVRVFFQLASDLVDNFKTERSTNHNRQTLFLFEETNKFGYFKVIENICCFKRSSGVKAVLVVQNIDQLERHYPNKQDLLSNCDKLFYGLSADDEAGLSLVSKAMGGFKETAFNGQGVAVEHNRNVLEVPEVKELIDSEGLRQILIPIQGKIIKIDRVPCYKNFAWTRH